MDSVPSAAANAVRVATSGDVSSRKHVQGYEFNDGIDYKKILQSFSTTGFQATNFDRAVEQLNLMLLARNGDFEPDLDPDEWIRCKSGCTIFFGYTSNMISSGIRESIRFLVQHKLVDCIVTTAGGIEEDLIKCLAPTLIGDFKLSGKQLRDDGINRIGNLLVPNENYCKFEDWLKPILDEVLAEQSETNVWSPSKLISRLGERIGDPQSVCYWAAVNKIPIFCPAPTDGSLGDMIFFHSFKNPGLQLDYVQDIQRINSLVAKSVRSGLLIIGGGEVKHHLANALMNGADFAVVIDTANEYDGSASCYDNPMSPDGGQEFSSPIKITADASLIFPLLVAATFARHHHDPHSSRSCPPNDSESIRQPCPHPISRRKYLVPSTAAHAIRVTTRGDPNSRETLEEYDFNTVDDHDKILQLFSPFGSLVPNFPRAVEQINKMLSSRDEPFEPDLDEDEWITRKSGCAIFIGFTSSEVASGNRATVRFLVQNKLVDCLVTTAGAIEEDLMRCLSSTVLSDYEDSGKRLRDEQLNAIVMNENYRKLVHWLEPILDEMSNEQKETGVWTPSKLIRRLGEKINDPLSICYWAAANKIPIFCPAIASGFLGRVIFSHSLRKSGLVMESIQDIRRINCMAMKATRSGMLIIGGGVIKHHIANANLMRNGADFAVFINTASEYDGSDSGASPDEAISWGKIKRDASPVKLATDANLIFPLLVAHTFLKYHSMSLKSSTC